MANRQFKELWCNGLPDAIKYADDTKESTHLVLKGMQTLAKLEHAYAIGLEGMKASYGLKAFDKETSVSYAWESVLNGLADEAVIHKRVGDELLSVHDQLEKCWKTNCDERKVIASDANAATKDIAEYEAQATKTKGAYQKAAKAAEAAIDKKDEGLRDPTKSQLSDVFRMNEALEIFTKARESYVDAMVHLQAAELD